MVIVRRQVKIISYFAAGHKKGKPKIVKAQMIKKFLRGSNVHLFVEVSMFKKNTNGE